jgi:HEAT repeat protein
MSLDDARSEESEARRHAIAALPGDAVEQHLDALLDLLRDGDWRVRREAALAIARTPAPERALDPLLDAVTGDDVEARNAALEAIRNLGHAATGAVLARLATTHGPARRFVIEALVEGADAGCVAPLRALLSDDDPNVPPAAAEVLGVIAGAEALAALGEAVVHRDAVVRLAALLAFEARRELAGWDAVVALVDDPVCAVYAVRALAAHGSAAALAHVVAALTHPRAAVTSTAVTLCGQLARARDARSPALRRALRDRSDALASLVVRAEQGPLALRVAATAALGLAGAPEALDVLLHACGASDAELAVTAAEALASLDPALVPAALAKAQAIGGATVAAVMAWGLHHEGPVDDATLNLAWASLDRHGAPATAWEFLARFGSDDDARMLAERLGRRAAASGDGDGLLAVTIERLQAAGRADALALLQGFVAPSVGGVAVASALRRSGVAVDESVVEAALRSPEPDVRAAALRALPAEHAALDLAAARAHFDDPDEGVRAALLDAVSRRAVPLATAAAIVDDGGAPSALRAVALRALAGREGDADPRVLGGLRDASEEVALEALRALRDDVPDGALAEALTHGSPVVRAEVALRMSPERDRGALAARLRAEDNGAVREVIEARLRGS